MMPSHDEPRRHADHRPFSLPDGRPAAALLGVFVFGSSLMIADEFALIRSGSTVWSIVVIGAFTGFLIWWRAFRIKQPRPTPFLPETFPGAILTGLVIAYVGLGLSFAVLLNTRPAVTWARRYVPLIPMLSAVGFAVFLYVRAQRIQKNRPSPSDCQHCGYNLTGNVSGICPECGTAIPPEPSKQ